MVDAPHADAALFTAFIVDQYRAWLLNECRSKLNGILSNIGKPTEAEEWDIIEKMLIELETINGLTPDERIRYPAATWFFMKIAYDEARRSCLKKIEK